MIKCFCVFFIIFVFLGSLISAQSRLWRCANGQRIQWSKTCDGTFDCTDRSDETTSECRSIVFEPELTESAPVSRRKGVNTKVNIDQMTQMTQMTQITTTTDKPRIIEQKAPDSCRITKIPRNGYVYDRYEPDIHLKVNHIVQNNDMINFGCNENQLFIGERHNYCINGTWSQDFPTCTPLCSPKKLTSISFESTCKFEREKISCKKPAMPGSTARVLCNQGYESFQAEEQTSVCGVDGRWYPEPSACNQVCGNRKVLESTTFWHALIYKLDNSTSQFELLCSGTILNAHILLSAMNCFWDDVAGGPFNASLYKVKVGKLYKEFDDKREKKEVQTISIKNIIKSPAWQGSRNGFLGDIAILLLDNYIVFKTHIFPICIDYNLKYDNDVIDNYSLVAGWHPIEQFLLDSIFGYKNTSELNMSDKYCMRPQTPVLGGAGLAIRKNIDGVETWFVKSIATKAPFKENLCDEPFVATTNTTLYLDFIKKHEIEFRPTANANGCPTLTTSQNGYITYYGSDGLILTKNESDYYDSGSTAVIDCVTGYEIYGASQQNLTCDKTSVWTPLLQDITCVPICGSEAPIGTPYIVGGNETDIHKVPWHVGVYKIEGPRINYKCGGSILSETTVISAMHCFWDRSTESAFDPSLYKVTAGKEYVDYLSTQEPYKVQYFDVNDLKYYDYRDVHGNFASDIVLVVLNNRIEFRHHIAPICLQVDQVTVYDVPVEDGLVGTLAGWGLTKSHGLVSNRLKIVELPSVNKEKCIADSGVGFQDFVTLDKFCAGHLNLSISACQGDSGGGLVFPKMIDGRKKYFLRGIVSVGANNLDSCDSSKYSTFTNVIYHDKFIRSVLLAN